METKEHVLHAKRISILIDSHATRSNTHIAQTLACGLEGLGKHVHITSQPPHTRAQPTCTVVLRGLGSRVAQVSYERDNKNQDLKLHFFLQQGKLVPEDISFDIVPQSDLTIIVGDRNHEHNTQEAYGHVLELLLNSEDSKIRLLGIVLFKLKQPQTPSAPYVATLTPEDTQTSLVQEKDVAPVITNLRAHFGEQSSYMVCFEKSVGQTQHILWTPNTVLIEQIQRRIQIQSKGNWVLYTTSTQETHTLHQQLFL